MQKSSFKPGLWALVILLLVSIACNLVNRAEPVATEVIPVTTEAVNNLEKNIQDAGKDIESSGQTKLTIDEQELTSLIAFELQGQEIQVYQDPQVYLRDGQIKMIGNVQQGNTTAPLESVFNVSANADGRLEYKLVSAKLGPLPLPDFLLEQISTQIDAAFASKIEPQLEDIFIERIDIADGVMTIQGHKR
jgi:uncharacterized protein YpmS